MIDDSLWLNNGGGLLAASELMKQICVGRVKLLREGISWNVRELNDPKKKVKTIK